jgi:hypothetical protein
MVYELWRRADICVSLMDVLEEMLQENKISEELAVKLMEQVGPLLRGVCCCRGRPGGRMAQSQPPSRAAAVRPVHTRGAGEEGQRQGADKGGPGVLPELRQREPPRRLLGSLTCHQRAGRQGAWC